MAQPPDQSRSAAKPGRSIERSSYLADLSHVKTATIESEEVFFERLEKEHKLDAARMSSEDARLTLRRVQRGLNPTSLDRIDQAAQELDRADLPIDGTSRALQAAHHELRRYHEGSTPQVVAIAQRRIDATPFLARVRRYIKSAERELRAVSTNLSETRRVSKDAASRLDRERQAPAAAELEKADALLAETAKLVEALLADLEACRGEFFPDCPPLPANAQPGDGPVGALALLNQSLPAMNRLADATSRLADVDAKMELAGKSIQTASDSVLAGDAAERPVIEAVRQLNIQATELLNRAEDQLFDTQRALAQDLPGEVKRCPDCGRELGRTRRVLDSAFLCAHTDQSMLKAEDTLKLARSLVEQMNKALVDLQAAARPDDAANLAAAIKELSGDKGVLDQLAVAVERGEEFRKQRFDFYPGESHPPGELLELPTRDFPPMFATYVARVNWHYPVYFEDISLERYGHHFGCLQPAVSTGKFFIDLAMLPYNMYLDPPCEMQYTHGLYRPGDCVPHLIYLPRPDLHAALFAAGVWTGLLYLP